MTLSKAQKWLGTLVGVGGIVSLFGTYQYLPKRVDDVKEEVAELKHEVRVDHDSLIEIRTKVSNIEKSLERNQIIQNNKGTKYYDAKQSYVYGVGYTNVDSLRTRTNGRFKQN